MVRSIFSTEREADKRAEPEYQRIDCKWMLVKSAARLKGEERKWEKRNLCVIRLTVTSCLLRLRSWLPCAWLPWAVALGGCTVPYLAYRFPRPRPPAASPFGAGTVTGRYADDSYGCVAWQ